jgi:hypothetical protein
MEYSYIKKKATRSGLQRCKTHELIVGIDGYCVLCRREKLPQAPPTSARNRWFAILLSLTAGLLVSAFFYQLSIYVRIAGRRGSLFATRSAPPSSANKSPTAQSKALTLKAALHPPRLPRPVVQPANKPQQMPPAELASLLRDPPQTQEEQLAAREKMMRLIEDAVRIQALHRVSVVMYVASW